MRNAGGARAVTGVRRAFVALGFLFLCCLAGGVPAARAQVAAAEAVRATQYFPPLDRPPLDPPLGLSGSFGEYRSGHFHAGLDFATGGQVGLPVYASLPGSVLRVRASGAGYGRAVYLQADDGRLLVYGHLDAFDEPLASYVATVQDSAGEYEQDLWPAPERFRVSAGQRLGWSGRSGTDAPHLHFEVRRGDVAYNPLLAGVSVEDTVKPVIRRVALAPVRSRADASWEDQPQLVECTGSDTALITGQERLVVEALDARADGQFTMAPWRVALEGDGLEVECRFDSVSWAEGMSEVDFVYDRGRAMPAGRHAVVLGAPPGFRPRVLRARGPVEGGAGALAVPSSGRPLKVRLIVQDVAGHTATQTLALGPASAGGRGAVAPGGTWVTADSAAGGVLPGFAWSVSPGALFETSRLSAADLGRPEAPDELKARSRVFTLGPALTPLRRPLRVELEVAGLRPGPAAGGARATGGESAATALYRDSGGGWESLGADLERRAGWIGAETRALGRFALFSDAAAPRIRLLPPSRAAGSGPAGRWALEARITEEGSGVDARASYFVVDGRRVPSEWDAVANTLRWRPLRPPGSGRHGLEIVVADRARNVRRRHAGFVLD
jgi:hypothetical protein